jgi:hypothetical protein
VWHRHWFVLDYSGVRVLRDPHLPLDTEVLEVNGNTEVRASKEDPLVFELHTPHHHPYVMRAASTESREDWMADLEEILPLVTKSANNHARAQSSSNAVSGG